MFIDETQFHSPSTELTVRISTSPTPNDSVPLITFRRASVHVDPRLKPRIRCLT